MGSINTFHSGGWRVELSNLPQLNRDSAMKYFDNYCVAVVVPDYNILEYVSPGPDGVVERHPISRSNEDLSQLQIDFKITEDFKNYFYLLEWMVQQRVREINTTKDQRLWKNVIERITVKLLDNQKNEVGQLYFTEARIVSLSSFVLDNGTEDEVLFTANFSYREFGLQFTDFRDV